MGIKNGSLGQSLAQEVDQPEELGVKVTSGTVKPKVKRQLAIPWGGTSGPRAKSCPKV